MFINIILLLSCISAFLFVVQLLFILQVLIVVYCSQTTPLQVLNVLNNLLKFAVLIFCPLFDTEDGKQKTEVIWLNVNNSPLPRPLHIF